ncbi:hypothetical protein NE237_016183 [Protea cynaroides]|uniref:3'-5' exonuclease domain-containing protein n=1 Tax=Protea cynaroides TaxID=273540 RepID=A0A9Q0KFC8_9MAGN|nr:hypothetical protein NE237_016183 [Protea cynaroides]
MNDDYITIKDHNNEDTHLRELYSVTVFGNRVSTTVTRRATVVRKWIYRIRHRHRFRRNRFLVGLGVQWRPDISNQGATLQLCVGRQCLIFQILHANFIPRILKRFLANDSITFVGVYNHTDSRMLKRDYNLSVVRLLELGSVANLRGASMETLAYSILGFHGIKKPQWIARSDWEVKWLTSDQVQYASVDAYLSFEIGKKLKAWNHDT